MKRILIVSVLVGAIAVVAFANLSDKKEGKQKMEKKDKATEKKKECKRTCLFS